MPWVEVDLPNDVQNLLHRVCGLAPRIWGTYVEEWTREILREDEGEIGHRFRTSEGLSENEGRPESCPFKVRKLYLSDGAFLDLERLASERQASMAATIRGVLRLIVEMYGERQEATSHGG